MEGSGTLNILDELEQDYQSIMGVRTNGNNSYYSIEEEIAYLHERIDQINRDQIHNRLRSPSNLKRTKNACTQTSPSGYLNDQNRRDVRSGPTRQDFTDVSGHRNTHDSASSNLPQNDIGTANPDYITPCHFCGGSGIDLSQFAAWKLSNGELPFVAPSHPKMIPRANNTNPTDCHDNKRHISWAYINTGQTQQTPKVSHIYLELSTSPLKTTEKQNKHQEHTTNPPSTNHSETEHYRPRHRQYSESDSRVSCSESELDLKESDSYEVSESESETDDYVTLRRTNVMYRHPSFGTSVDFADGEESNRDSGEQQGEVSPFVTFVSNLDNVQQKQQQQQYSENHVPHKKQQKRNLKPSHRNIKDRRPTPGPSGYHGEISEKKSGKDVEEEEIDIDLEDPEVQEAAVKMQAAFKGFSARKKMGLGKKSKPEEEKKEMSPKTTVVSPDAEEIDIDLKDPEVEMAAIKMQAAFKGFSARKKMGTSKGSKPSEPKVTPQDLAPLTASKANIENNELADLDMNDPELAAAATKMQAAFKGFNARKKMGMGKDKQPLAEVPKFKEEMYLEVSEDGSSARLSCRLATTKPLPIVTWFHNDDVMAIDSDPDHRIWCSQEKDGRCMLTIYDVDDVDSGVYSCRAKSSAGETVTTGELDHYEDSVTASDEDELVFSSGEEESTSYSEDQYEMENGDLCPYFTFTPQSRVVERGMTAKFICGVIGSPVPQVKWFTAGSKLQIDGSKYRTYNSIDSELGNVSVLEINHADLTDAGEYVCIASNEGGQVYCSAELTVEDNEDAAQDQVIEEHGASHNFTGFDTHGNNDTNDAGQHQSLKIFGVEGTTTKFHSTFAGPSRPLLTWLKDGGNITSSESVVQYEGDTSFGLEVANIKHSDAGLYSCMLGEDRQEEICNFQLVVLDVKDSKTQESFNQQPNMSSTLAADNQKDLDVDPEYDMRDSGYSQAPSSNLSQADGWQEAVNSNSEQNSTTCSRTELNEDDMSSPRVINMSEPSTTSHPLDDNKTSGVDETMSKHVLQRSQSTQQFENHPKKKSDSSRERRLPRRNSSPNKLKSLSLDQKDSTSRRRRERRRSSQSVDHEMKCGVGARHRSSLDLSPTKGQKNGTKRTRYSLPSSLEELDDSSFDRISRLNSRLNLKVDNCLSLVDSVLQLNASAFDPEQEETLRTKLRELSASLSDTSLSDDDNDGDVNGDRKKEGVNKETIFFFSDDDDDDDDDDEKNDATKTLDKKSLNNLESMEREISPSSGQLEHSNFISVDLEHADKSLANRQSPFEKEQQQDDYDPNNETETLSLDATIANEDNSLVEPGSVIISDGSESDVVRPRLDTVAEETEDSDGRILDTKEDTGDELSNDMASIVQNGVSPDAQVKMVQPETEIIKSQESIPLQSALPNSTFPPTRTLPPPITLPILNGEVGRTPSPSSPSPSSRKISIEELLALDSLPESVIDDKYGSPTGSPSRKVNRDYNRARHAQETLLKESSRTSPGFRKEKVVTLQRIESEEDMTKGGEEKSLHLDKDTKDNHKAISDLNQSPVTDTPSLENSEITETVAPLRFTQPLKDIMVLDGDAVRLEVDIEGTPTPTVKWYKARKEMSPEQCAMSYDGEGRWSLVIRQIMRSDEGEYTCTASNRLSTVSSACFLRVTGLFGSTGEDESEYSTSASGKETTPDVKERSHSEPVVKTTSSPSPDGKARSQSLSIVLRTPPTLQNDVTDGKTRKAGPIGPSVPSLADPKLPTEEPILSPTVAHQEDQAQRQDDFALEKSLDANANVTVITSRDLSNVPLEDAPVEDGKRLKPKISRDLTRESTLSIDPYSTPGSVSDVSDTEGAPEIIQRLHALDVLEGQDAELTIKARGNPEPEVHWYKDGLELRNDSRVCVEQDGDTWKLIIEGVVIEDDGKYVCKVLNDLGQDTSSAIIYVEPLTENEANLLTDEEESETAELRWREPSLDRDVEMEEDEEEMHRQLDARGGSTDVDMLLYGNFPVENEIADVLKDGEELPGQEADEQGEPWLVNTSDGDQNDTNLNRPASLTLTTTSTDGEIPEDTNDTTPSPVHRIPARAKLLSQEQLLLGDVEEEKSQDISEVDASLPESQQLMETYVASADYTPSPSSKENIPLVEGQEVEVLDSKSTSEWLIRTRDKKTREIQQGWVPASHLSSMLYRSSTMPGPFRRQESRIVDISELDQVDTRLSRKEAEAQIKRGLCIAELLNGEKEFVKNMSFCINHFIPPVDHPNVPAFLKGKKDIIFCNIKDIHEFHKDTFLKELEMCENDADSIGKAFIKFAPNFDNLYVKYCENMNRTVKNEMTPAVKDFFGKYGGRKGRGEMDIQSYLIKPVQRISRYTLIIKDLIKYTVRANQDCKHLQIACDVMTEVPKKADNLLTISQIEGFRGDLKNLGKLHRRDEFTVWHGKCKGKSKPRMVFLFDEMMMFTKVKRSTDHNTKDPVSGYVYKSHIVIPGIDLVRSKELNDDRKLEVMNEKPHFIHRTLQATNSYVIEAWTKELLDLAEIAQLEGRKPLIVRNRTHSLIRKGSFRGSVRSISSQRSISGSIRSITGSMSSFNSSETGSIGAQSIVSNRSSESGLSLYSLPFTGPSTDTNNRASFVSYVSNAESDVVKFTPEVGRLYEIQHNVIANGIEGLELSKGDVVKVLQVCDDATFHIQTIPTESFPYTKDGYVMKEYLKKIDDASHQILIDYIESSVCGESGEEERECPPEFTERTKSLTVNVGGTAAFICQFSGIPNPEAEWNIPENRVLDERLEVTTSRGCSTLIIYRVKKKDEREYTCTLSNRHGCVSCSAKLNVTEPTNPKPTPMDVNSTNSAKSKLSLHRKLTPPLSLFQQNPSPDLSSSGTGDEGFKPMTVNNDTIVHNSVMPYNSNTLIQPKSTSTMLNLDDSRDCDPRPRLDRRKLDTLATDNTMCNITEIPWCSNELTTKCQSHPRSLTPLPLIHCHNSAINGKSPVAMTIKRPERCCEEEDHCWDARLLERQHFCCDGNRQCAICKSADDYLIAKVRDALIEKLCATEEDKAETRTITSTFAGGNSVQPCHFQANRVPSNDDYSVAVHSLSAPFCHREPQVLYVC